MTQQSRLPRGRSRRRRGRKPPPVLGTLDGRSLRERPSSSSRSGEVPEWHPCGLASDAFGFRFSQPETRRHCKSTFRLNRGIRP